MARAGLGDVEEIAQLFDHYRQFYKQASDLPAARDFLRARLSNEESVIFHAQIENKSIGFVQLYPTFSSVSMRRLWVLNDLYVAPEARRKSVARQLLHAAAEFSRSTEARGLTLKTALDNLAAQNLYSSLGWIRDERFCSYNLIGVK